jgi:hypothetical protein
MKIFTPCVRQLLLALSFTLFLGFIAAAQTTTFTYRGKLPDGGIPLPGSYDLQFNLYEEASGADSPLNSAPIVIENVEITTDGYVVSLDFGNLFSTGADRFLEIGYRTSTSSGAFTILSQRQQITSAPYTIRSLSASTADTSTNAQNLGGTEANAFVQTTDSRLSDPRLPVGGSDNYIQNTTGLQSDANFNVSGTGSAGIFNATTQFNIGGNRVLSIAGTRNIFAGDGSGITGTDNSFFGYQAGMSNTTGQTNAFFGMQTGKNNTTGYNNSFIGMQAGLSNTTGYNNTFFGVAAGGSITTGRNNTMLGAGANSTTNNLFYSTAIGAGASVSTSDTIVLGKVAGDNYDGVPRPADTVIIPGNLSVAGTITGNFNGGFTNLNASNITSGTLGDARLSSNIATLSGVQTFTGAKTFSGGIIGNGSGLTNLNASNITSGTLDNARLGVIGITNGGTGLTSPGANGSFLRSNGSSFISSALQALDIPDLSAGYIQNTTTQQANANFNVSGNGVIGGNLSVTGALNASGTNLTNLNASNITAGTLDNGRLGLIPTANIADGAVTAPKISDSTIETSKIADNAVNNAKIANGAVTAPKIADNSITTAKIADNAVTGVKIGGGQVVKNLNGLTDNVTLAAGANVTITPSGNTLTVSATIPGGNFIQNTTTQQPGSNFNISGDGAATNLTAGNTLSGNIVNATTQFNIGGNRVLSIAGANNTFTGIGAGSNTAGGNNSFFGFGSGLNNTTGNKNSFFGVNAGASNTTGISNSFFGFGAGFGNTTGSQNLFAGYDAGYTNSTGYNNSFIGIKAGFSNTEGISNSFVGSYAGYNNTTGYNNSFAGFKAGYSNTTGSLNTIIGTGADVGVNNLSYATAIGAQATVSSSNTIALGRSDGSDKVRIFGLGAAGSVQLCRNANNEISSCSSSLRYKTNIAQFSFGLSVLRRLRPITFTWKDGGGIRDLGFGAEDVAAIEPLLVTYNQKGEVEGVKYDRISAVLVNSVKEQQIKIEEQQTQIEALQQQLKQQQTVIEGLKKLFCSQNPKADICR